MNKFWNVTITLLRTSSVLGISKMTINNKLLTFPRRRQIDTRSSNLDIFWDGKYNSVDSCYICSRNSDGSVNGRYSSLQQSLDKKKYVAYNSKIYSAYTSKYASRESNTNSFYEILNFSGLILYSMYTGDDYYNIITNNLQLLKLDNKDVSLFTLQTITGIKGESVKSKITVYPNPTTSKVKLNSGFEGSNQIELADFTGKVLQTFNSNISETEIDLSTYAEGMYFFKITNRSGSYISKVVLSKNY